ncbi:hypothetical protein LCGC14_1035110 [marine sediment metagenome]|uniref:Uncharacterized protein n=1 Tax=marine sediment metagenome TaxID=412755 RepID=A0A0F9NF10_9ZZZZ
MEVTVEVTVIDILPGESICIPEHLVLNGIRQLKNGKKRLYLYPSGKELGKLILARVTKGEDK